MIAVSIECLLLERSYKFTISIFRCRGGGFINPLYYHQNIILIIYIKISTFVLQIINKSLFLHPVRETMPDRLMAGRLFLVQSVEVRILFGQQ